MGGYRGFKKGLVLEIFSVLALILAKVGSIRLVRRVLTIFLGWYQGLDSVLNYLLLTLLFFLIMIAVTMIGRFIRYLIRPTILGSADRFLGSIVGVFKWALCISACIWLGDLWNISIPVLHTADTMLFPYIKALAPQLFAMWSAWWPGFHRWWATFMPSLTDYMDLQGAGLLAKSFHTTY